MTDIESPKLSDFFSQEALESMPFPVGVYDREGLLVAVNAHMEALLGVSREHVVGHIRHKDFESNPAYEEILAASRRGLAGEVVTLPPTRIDIRHLDLLSKTNSRPVMWIDGKYFPLRDAEGRVCFLMLVNTDQTELMEQREAVMAARGEIMAQRETIQALSSPVIEVWRGVLALPVIGRVDAERATDMTSRLLEVIARTRSRFAILDLTGVQGVDAQAADSFMRIVRAVELLGAEGILVGIQPASSRVLAELDVDMAGLRTFRTLGDALEVCIRALRSRELG